eukprot:2800824-Pyramimonas_sp.AAC.1
MIEGIQRWQHRRLLHHMHTSHGNERVWHRALRGGLQSIRCPRQLGALSAIMADEVPLPGVRASQGYQIAPDCRVCQAPLGSYGHI